jgi:hypothetical protein
MNVNQITASEFLSAVRKGVGNAAEKPALRQTLDELKKFPETQQRLVFEFLDMAVRLVESKVDPAEPILWAVRWHSSVEETRIPDYLKQLEKILVRYFEQLRSAAHAAGGHPWILTFAIGLGAIRDIDKTRFQSLIDTLQRQCGDPILDHRFEILAEARKLVPQS